MAKDAQLEELHTKYNQVCDRIDGYWDDFHSLDEDDEFNASEISSLKGRIGELDCEADDLWQQVLKRARDMVTEALSSEALDNLEFGYHECGGSPTNQCVYDIDEDPCRDACLFCGDPEERK